MRCPSAFDPGLNCGSGYSRFTSPVMNCFRDSIYRDSVSVSFVSSLKLLGNPNAIAWSISLINVLSFKGTAHWHWPQVSKKSLEATTAKPSTAHFNPTSAVCVVMRIVWVAATLFGVIVRKILTGITFAVRACATPRHFPSQTPAAFNESTLERVCAECFSLSAIAQAIPKLVMPPLPSDVACNNQPHKSFTSQVM